VARVNLFLTTGAHYRAGRGLRNIGQVIPGIRDFGHLPVSHIGRRIRGFGLNDRRIVRDRNFIACFRNLKGDIHRCWWPNLDGNRPFVLPEMQRA